MINLTTVRHDPGKIVHVFDTPDRHTKAVSALLLTNDEQHLVSGGWDNQVKVSASSTYQFSENTLQQLSVFWVGMGSEYGTGDTDVYQT